MNYIRAIKDKSARHIMLGIAIFAMVLLVVIGISLFLKALPIMKEKESVGIAYLRKLETF